MAIGTIVSDPGPIESASGVAAAIMAMEVIRIGLRRIGQASKSASLTPIPCLHRSFVKSTSRIEFFLTIPMRSINPIILYRFSELWLKNRKRKAPVTLKGKISLAGWLYQGNSVRLSVSADNYVKPAQEPAKANGYQEEVIPF